MNDQSLTVKIDTGVNPELKQLQDNAQLLVAERQNWESLMAKYTALQDSISKIIAEFKADGLREDELSKEHYKRCPGCQQSCYRAGAANTFTEVVEKLQSISTQ